MNGWWTWFLGGLGALMKLLADALAKKPETPLEAPPRVAHESDVDAAVAKAYREKFGPRPN